MYKIYTASQGNECTVSEETIKRGVSSIVLVFTWSSLCVCLCVCHVSLFNKHLHKPQKLCVTVVVADNLVAHTQQVSIQQFTQVSESDQKQIL